MSLCKIAGLSSIRPVHFLALRRLDLALSLGRSRLSIWTKYSLRVVLSSNFDPERVLWLKLCFREIFRNLLHGPLHGPQVAYSPGHPTESMRRAAIVVGYQNAAA